MSDRGAGDSERPRKHALALGPTGRDAADSAPPASGPVAPVSGTVAPLSDQRNNRRMSARVDVTWSVDCETEDTFLYASITNISEMGIFVRTNDPLVVGTQVTLRFAPLRSDQPFVLEGIVQWVNELRPLHDNPNPGMGIRFSNLTPDDRERIVDVIRTIAYLRDNPSN